MTITYTSKLGLPVDTLGEGDISVQKSVWAKVDSAAGVLPTVKGRAIPDSTLYPGALCAETDTGISWRAIPVGDGTYTKQYMNYPYNYVAYSKADAINNAVVGNTQWGWDTISSAQSFNWNASDKGSGNNAWKAPIKALYSVAMNVQWYASNTASLRVHQWSLNNVLQDGFTDMTLSVPGFTTALTVAMTIKMNPGDYLRPVFWQNSGVALQMDCYIYVQLVRPVV